MLPVQPAQTPSMPLEHALPAQQQMAFFQQSQPPCAFLVLQAVRYVLAVLLMHVLHANMDIF